MSFRARSFRSTSFEAFLIGIAVVTCSLVGAQTQGSHSASTNLAGPDAESVANAPMALNGTDSRPCGKRSGG